MPISTLWVKSMPSTNSRKPCTKCCRDCSPSHTMSMPASSCNLIASSVASSLPAASSSPCRRHWGHSLHGSASQDGFGRLPEIVDGNIMRQHSRNVRAVAKYKSSPDVRVAFLHLSRASRNYGSVPPDRTSHRCDAEYVQPVGRARCDAGGPFHKADRRRGGPPK